MNVLAVCARLLTPLLAAQVLSASTVPLTVVERVDLSRYVGTWYEIARYPNRFQSKCESDTTATYTRRKDGKIQVVNACRQKNGTITTARGMAKVVDSMTNAKLKVTFFWPFYGDYWIIGLGSDYEYAIVGEPDRQYLWILSRTPAMSDTVYRDLLHQIEGLGYEPAKLMKTLQSATGK